MGILKLILPGLLPVAVAAVGWSVVHSKTLEQQAARQRNEYLARYLIDSYRNIERAARRDLKASPHYARGLEEALAEIQILGSPEAVDTVFEAAELLERGGGDVTAILKLLRKELRLLLELEPLPDDLAIVRIPMADPPRR